MSGLQPVARAGANCGHTSGFGGPGGQHAPWVQGLA